MSILTKEIITTTTEKYNEEGSIIEKITEAVEKFYDKPVEEFKQENKREDENSLIQEVADSINVEMSEAEAAKVINSQLPTNPQPQRGVLPPQIPTVLPQYNVVGRQAASTSPAFPWEQSQQPY